MTSAETSAPVDRSEASHPSSPPELTICNGVVVVTDDSDDAGMAAARAVGAELAGRAQVPVILYDRSRETWVDTPHPEGPLAIDDSRLDDRPHLRQQMHIIADEGIEAAAWLSTVPTISGVTTALTRSGADVVVIADTAKRKLLERTLDGKSLAHAIAILVDRHSRLDASVIEVGTDGTTSTIRAGSPSSGSAAGAATGDLSDAHDTPSPDRTGVTDQGGDTTTQGADTLLGVLAHAADDGYGEQFIAEANGLVRCGNCGTTVPASTLSVAHTYRLEGASDPADLLLVLACRCPACGAGGVLTLGYGPNASAEDVAVSTALPLN